MNTNYATPVATNVEDTFVPVAEWEKLLMVWTLRSLNPLRDGFTTISWAIQQDGTRYHVVERENGMIPQETFGRTFESKDEALDFWGQMIRSATPPCVQGALPGFVQVVPDFLETYAYMGGFGSGPCSQSHLRVGGWS